MQKKTKIKKSWFITSKETYKFLNIFKRKKDWPKINFFGPWWAQGRSDGVSRVSNAYGPTAEGGPPWRKFILDILKKAAKSRKITNF
jgi:hypothetical protein